MKSLHAFVSGRVQGVGYRAFTSWKANLLKLKGFVRNLPDGRVEVYVEGSDDSIQKFLRHLKKGPTLSYVSNVDYVFGDSRGDYEGFSITY